MKGERKFYQVLIQQNDLFWLTSFCFPHRIASSGLQEMFSYIIPLVIDNPQEMFSSMILLVADDTSVVLCAWDSLSSYWFLILSSVVVTRTCPKYVEGYT